MSTERRTEEDKITEILRQDERYSRAAYHFIQEALEFTVQRRGRQGHVTGRELVMGLRQLVLERFGLMAKTVLNQWGIYATSDFGEIVFNMIEAQIMSRQDSDTRNDFIEVYDFDEAFDNVIDIKIDD